MSFTATHDIMMSNTEGGIQGISCELHFFRAGNPNDTRFTQVLYPDFRDAPSPRCYEGKARTIVASTRVSDLD